MHLFMWIFAYVGEYVWSPKADLMSLPQSLPTLLLG